MNVCAYPMTTIPDPYTESILRAFFGTAPPHPPPSAQQLPPGPKQHFRALVSALMHARSGLSYVQNALTNFTDDARWTLVEDTVARELATSALFVAGVLDGMVVLEATWSGQTPLASMSFERTPFANRDLRRLQDATKAFASSAQPDQSHAVDFETLVSFWRHYFPYKPRPSVFELRSNRKTVRDIAVSVGQNCKTGPILLDLLLPTFNAACAMMLLLSNMLQEPFEVQSLEYVR